MTIPTVYIVEFPANSKGLIVVRTYSRDERLRKEFNRLVDAPRDFVRDAEDVAAAFGNDPKIPKNLMFRFASLSVIPGGL